VPGRHLISQVSPAAQASRAWPAWRPGTGTMWHWPAWVCVCY